MWGSGDNPGFESGGPGAVPEVLLTRSLLLLALTNRDDHTPCIGFRGEFKGLNENLPLECLPCTSRYTRAPTHTHLA